MEISGGGGESNGVNIIEVHYEHVWKYHDEAHCMWYVNKDIKLASLKQAENDSATSLFSKIFVCKKLWGPSPSQRGGWQLNLGLFQKRKCC